MGCGGILLANSMELKSKEELVVHFLVDTPTLVGVGEGAVSRVFAYFFLGVMLFLGWEEFWEEGFE